MRKELKAWAWAVLAICCACATPTSAQEKPPPCSLPEFRQFDFWLGSWDLAWGDSGRGTNQITLALDSCVIEEKFSTLGDTPFRGRSFSTYNVVTKQWHQTWVDNRGNYLDFVGGMVDDSMILSRSATDTSGNDFFQRMVFHSITADSLRWSWERSIDRGQTWEVLWPIRYNRSPSDR